jgi:dienelactone hydrolase
MTRIVSVAVAVLLAAPAAAKIITQEVAYEHAGAQLVGYLAYDDTVAGRRPGVLVVHEWWGLNDYAKKRARDLAGLGYVALAVDMYGGGKTTTQQQEASKLSGELYEDLDKLRGRARAGYEVLAAHERVDPRRIAAIGYCFGGMTVCQMAYSGLELAGVVSFHGSLRPPEEADSEKIKARLLICHGADDPLIPAEHIEAFQAGLRKAGADWQMVSYGGAVHSFTNPGAGAAGIPGVRYDERADRRSWLYMQLFLAEVFGEEPRLVPAKPGP